MLSQLAGRRRGSGGYANCSRPPTPFFGLRGKFEVPPPLEPWARQDLDAHCHTDTGGTLVALARKENRRVCSCERGVVSRP